MTGLIIGVIAILILAIRLIQVMRSYDDSCVQVKLCAEGKMICSRIPKCKAYKHYSKVKRTKADKLATQGGKQ